MGSVQVNIQSLQNFYKSVEFTNATVQRESFWTEIKKINTKSLLLMKLATSQGQTPPYFVSMNFYNSNLVISIPIS